MSDYIKREDAIEKLESDIDKFDHVPQRVRSFFRLGLESVPSADVVEIRHGHWNFQGLVDDIYAHGASCSVCGEYSEDNGYYCSCCGAKMDDALQRKTNPEVFKGGEEHE